MDRFQNQKWYVKLWRYRMYFLIPIYSVKFYLNKEWSNSFRNSYNLAKGIVQSDMNWVYTTEEVFGKEYSFSVFFTSPLDDAIMTDKLYENGCDDATLSYTNGCYELDFDRCEKSLSDAIGSALYDIECSKIDAKIIRIEVGQ